MTTLFLILIFVAVGTSFYARSAGLKGNLVGARNAKLACVISCIILSGMNIVYYVHGGHTFEMVMAVLWAAVAYWEFKRQDLFKKPPSGTGKSQ